ncbi:MAG: SRPBCC family protein [Anaerolineales bacterium]
MSTSKNQTTVTAEPGKQEVIITREFDAPRELVYKAHIDPELYVQWLGPRGYQMILETFEPYSGGRYRYIHKDQNGNEFGFHGVFHEMSEELMIQTFEFEGLPERGHVTLDTMRLEKLPGDRTRVVVQSVFQSVEDRDGMVQAGMETGVREGYERLDELLERVELKI